MEERVPMPKASKEGDTGPKKRPRHHSYDESVDEPADLLEQEAVEIEKEVPAEDTGTIERIEPADGDGAAFEE
jgi:hypothetical protein